jgi:hypothetical protein
MSEVRAYLVVFNLDDPAQNRMLFNFPLKDSLEFNILVKSILLGRITNGLP